ncbi:MAG: hypothetical protein GY943_14915 [Chloroflexi bacterium]|nr:hypothetical protein [Chloroflexota bacterium]
MFPASFHLDNPLTRLEKLRQRVRISVIVITLALILYHTIYLAFFVPLYEIDFIWGRDNVVSVAAVPQHSTAAPYLQPGDTILAVDDRPMQWTVWQPQFVPGKAGYTYTVQRGDDLFTVSIPVAEPDFKFIRERITTGMVSLLTWLIGTIIILFATPQNRDAWQLGVATLGAAVVLAASEASLYGVPFAWLNTYPFLPMVSVALMQVALLPRRGLPSRREYVLFGTLYASGVISGFVALFELLYLNPHNNSLFRLTGMSLYELLYLWLGMGGLAYLGILAWRYIQMPDSYRRRQILIILTFTAVALLPAIFLTILPRLLFDAPLLPWDFSITLLALIPAGYGFVIYRKNYLGLDIFATNGLTYLLISLMLLSAYSLIYHFVQSQASLAALEPLSGSLLLLPVLMITPLASRQIQGKVETIIYGATSLAQKDRLQMITSALAADPQSGTLKKVMHDVTALLQVRQMALLLVDRQEQMVCVEQLRIDTSIKPIPQSVYTVLSKGILVRHQRDKQHPLFAQYEWSDYMAPLAIGDAVVGMLLLGRPVPDGYLHAKQIIFLRQVADIVAVATEAMRLFESSREMSRKLLRIRDEERRYLASQIHDEPLQDISMIANELGRMTKGVSDVAQMSELLNKHRRELQSTADQLRNVCVGLYPAELKQGAQWAVREVVYTLREKTGLDIALTVDVSHELIIPRLITVSIYYILKEALNNVHKHANATAVWVHFGHQEGQLVLSIADNGRHQSIASLPLSTLIRAHHFGVAGMHEWASLVDGHLTVAKRKSGGTAVSLIVPFASAQTDVVITRNKVSIYG